MTTWPELFPYSFSTTPQRTSPVRAKPADPSSISSASLASASTRKHLSHEPAHPFHAHEINVAAY
jgi:hypothetical protein